MKLFFALLSLILSVGSIGYAEQASLDFPVDCVVTYLGPAAPGANIRHVTLGKVYDEKGTGWVYSRESVVRLETSLNPNGVGTFALVRVIESDGPAQILLQLGFAPNVTDLGNFELGHLYASKQVVATTDLNVAVYSDIGSIQCAARKQ